MQRLWHHLDFRRGSSAKPTCTKGLPIPQSISLIAVILACTFVDGGDLLSELSADAVLGCGPVRPRRG